MRQPVEKTYLSCKQTAELLRKALRKAFPTLPAKFFSVRSHTYAGGASIDVRYTDGPPQKMVQRVCSRFCGSQFDGSIDLKVPVVSYLLPDGEVEFAGTVGTQGSGGFIAAEARPLPEGAVAVGFGADYVNADRSYSAEATLMIRARALVRLGCTAGEEPADPMGQSQSYHEAFWRAGEEFDFTPMLRGDKPRFRAGGWDAD